MCATKNKSLSGKNFSFCTCLIFLALLLTACHSAQSPTVTNATLLPTKTDAVIATQQPTKTDAVIATQQPTKTSIWSGELLPTDNFNRFLSNGSGIQFHPDIPNFSILIHPEWNPYWLIEGSGGVLITPSIREFNEDDHNQSSPYLVIFPTEYKGTQNIREVAEDDLLELFPEIFEPIESADSEMKVFELNDLDVASLSWDTSVQMITVVEGWQFNLFGSSPELEANSVMPILYTMLSTFKSQQLGPDDSPAVAKIPVYPTIELVVPEEFSRYTTAGDTAAWLTPDEPNFSISFPAEWESSWVGDSGGVAFLIAPDLELAWSGDPESEAEVLIIYDTISTNHPDMGHLEDWSMLELINEFWGIDGPILEGPRILPFSGHDAVIMSGITYDGELFIGAIVINDEYILHFSAYTDIENEEQMRPIFEAMIASIEFFSE